ncbi:hypothetical protein [Longimicrobium sp.]|uniref:hypothetical protein n=1 Tax=Longimicrobium sp. TaxID=2029185 RepID=UPI003B3BE721
MELHIKFTGLCLFVHPAGSARTHVLMPHVHDHGGGIEPHFVWCTFPGGNRVRIEGYAIEFSAATNATQGAPDATVVNVGTLAHKGVDAPQLGLTPRGSVAARVTLPPASDVDYGDTATWDVEVEQSTVDTRPFTHQLVWKIRNITSDVAWTVRPLQYQGPHAPVPAPAPPAGTIPHGSGTVHVEVSCLPEPVPTTPIPIGQEATHFQAYLTLLKPPFKRVKLKMKKHPLHAGTPTFDPHAQPADDDEMAALAYNCMLGQSPPA